MRHLPLRPTRRPAAAAVAAAAAALLVGAAQSAAAAPPAHPAHPVRYVALGDSYSSGLGIPDQVDANCGRSDHDYPSLVAQAIGADSFTDVTCAGATTAEMTAAQGTAAPQFDALTADTTLVTLGIGGNDIDVSGVVTRCGLLGLLLPIGAPCRTSYTLLGVDQVAATIDATAPKIDAVLQQIHARSPEARIVVVGYPDILPEDGTNCYATVPLTAGDEPWLRDSEKRLNSMLAQRAAADSATYADVYGPDRRPRPVQARGHPLDRARGDRERRRLPPRRRRACRDGRRGPGRHPGLSRPTTGGPGAVRHRAGTATPPPGRPQSIASGSSSHWFCSPSISAINWRRSPTSPAAR